MYLQHSITTDWGGGGGLHPSVRYRSVPADAGKHCCVLYMKHTHVCSLPVNLPSKKGALTRIPLPAWITPALRLVNAKPELDGVDLHGGQRVYSSERDERATVPVDDNGV